MEPEGVTMASDLSAAVREPWAVYVDSQVSTNYEPSVFLVTMASSLSATIYEVTISRYPWAWCNCQPSTTYEPWGVRFLLLLVVMHPYRWSLKVWLSAAVRVCCWWWWCIRTDGAWRWQWPATYQQPSVRCGALNYCKLYHYADGAVPMDQQPSMSREVSGSWRCDYQQPSMRWLSAAVREPVIWYVSFPHGEPSMWIVRYLRTMSRPCLLLVVVMHPYRWSRTDGAWRCDYQPPSMSREVSMWIVRYLRTMSRPCLLLVVMHPYRWSRTNGQQLISYHLWGDYQQPSVFL